MIKFWEKSKVTFLYGPTPNHESRTSWFLFLWQSLVNELYELLVDSWRLWPFSMFFHVVKNFIVMRSTLVLRKNYPETGCYKELFFFFFSKFDKQNFSSLYLGKTVSSWTKQRSSGLIMRARGSPNSKKKSSFTLTFANFDFIQSFSHLDPKSVL